MRNQRPSPQSSFSPSPRTGANSLPQTDSAPHRAGSFRFGRLRHPRLAALLVPLLVGLTVIVTGCGGSSASNVVLWSHRVDVAALVELYNAGDRPYKVEMRHIPDPATAIEDAAVPPDIIIADSIANEEIAGYFSPLGNLLERGPISDTVFYADLLQGGRIGGRQRLLPLSYDLPAVIFRLASENEALPDFALHVDHVRDQAAAFNQFNDGRYVRLGFSPRWNHEFLYLLSMLHGANFHEANRAAAWDEDGLRASVAYVRDWIAEGNSGIEYENAFAARYLYDPKYQLLMRERIRFAYVRASQLFRYTDSQRQRIDYRWVRSDQGIPVLENVVYVGLPQNSPNRRGAQDFVEWLLQAETHGAILESVRAKRIPDFGIAGGFSAIPEVNERYFPRYYPALLGRIAREDMLVFPRRVPRHWHALRTEVVEPWLNREVSALPQPRPLREEIRLWLLQRG